jgi:hypothetical protein
MQTVNFQCGSCSNLMAVGAEFLGQQVRCPHCQAVVVAPAAPAPAAVAPAPARAPDATETLPFSRPANEHEDIFAPPEPTDDLFGRPDAPRVELPPAAPAPQAPTLSLDRPGANGGSEPFGSTITFAGSQQAAPAAANDATLPSWMDQPAAPAAPPDHQGMGFHQAPAHTEGHEDAQHEALPQMIRRPRDNGGWFIGLVFIPLISYAILTTIALLILWARLQQAAPPPPNPLETLPALDPNDPKAGTHLFKDPRQSEVIQNLDVKTATGPVPDNQTVRLGGKLQLGDLQIEPQKVALEKVSVRVQGYNPEPCQYPSLVLHMKLRNISDNTVFQPMDTFFDRRWKGAKSSVPPLTILELALSGGAPRFFFGGPADFHRPLLTAQSGGDPPQWVEGNHYSQVLNPGEEMDTFVCTDGDDKPTTEAVENHHGKLLWRVHLRRGIVPYNGRLVPVSTVVGVEFTDEDYRKNS